MGSYNMDRMQRIAPSLITKTQAAYENRVHADLYMEFVNQF